MQRVHAPYRMYHASADVKSKTVVADGSVVLSWLHPTPRCSCEMVRSICIAERM
jgi:hypothetical protein